MKFAAAVSTSLLVGASAFAPSVSNMARQTTSLAMSDGDDFFGGEPSDGKKNEMSKALPFVPRPKILDGSLAGDAGFE